MSESKHTPGRSLLGEHPGCNYTAFGACNKCGAVVPTLEKIAAGFRDENERLRAELAQAREQREKDLDVMVENVACADLARAEAEKMKTQRDALRASLEGLSGHSPEGRCWCDCDSPIHQNYCVKARAALAGTEGA